MQQIWELRFWSTWLEVLPVYIVSIYFSLSRAEEQHKEQSLLRNPWVWKSLRKQLLQVMVHYVFVPLLGVGGFVLLFCWGFLLLLFFVGWEGYSFWFVCILIEMYSYRLKRRGYCLILRMIKTCGEHQRAVTVFVDRLGWNNIVLHNASNLKFAPREGVWGGGGGGGEGLLAYFFFFFFLFVAFFFLGAFPFIFTHFANIRYYSYKTRSYINPEKSTVCFHCLSKINFILLCCEIRLMGLKRSRRSKTIHI